MLQRTLSNIQEILTEKGILDAQQIKILLRFLKKRTKGEYILPGIIMRKLDVLETEVYELFSVLEDMNIIEANFQLYCHDCNTFQREIYTSLFSVPVKQHCGKCHEIVERAKNLIVIYRVIADE